MSSNESTLRRELKQAGADEAESQELAKLASQLGQLKQMPAVHKTRWWQHWQLVAVGLTAALALLVIFAQSSLPGSWLYAPKKVSENVAVAVDPNFRATLMMRRSEEVKALVAQHASQQQVLATLADYKVQVAAYKTDNYEAFEYCKNNLQQAAKVAPSQERTAIINTLASLQT